MQLFRQTAHRNGALPIHGITCQLEEETSCYPFGGQGARSFHVAQAPSWTPNEWGQAAVDFLRGGESHLLGPDFRLL